MRRLSLTVLLFALAAPLAAQTETAGLVRLHGSVVPVYYAPGSLERASRLQMRVENLLREVTRQGRVTPSLTVWVLGREEWEAQGFAVPYGIATARSSGSVAYPAWADERSIELWRKLLGGELPLPAVSATHASPQSQATLEVADLLVETELLRSVLTASGLLPGGEPWLDIVLAEAAMRSLALRLDPVWGARQVELYRSLAPRLAATAISPAELASGQLSAEQRARLEAALVPAAERVLDAEGDDVVKALGKLRKRGDGRVRTDDVLDRWPGLADLGGRLEEALR